MAATVACSSLYGGAVGHTAVLRLQSQSTLEYDLSTSPRSALTCRVPPHVSTRKRFAPASPRTTWIGSDDRRVNGWPPMPTRRLSRVAGGERALTPWRSFGDLGPEEQVGMNAAACAWQRLKF